MSNSYIANGISKKKFSDDILSKYESMLKGRINVVNNALSYISKEEELRLRPLLLIKDINEASDSLIADYINTINAINKEIDSFNFAIREAKSILNEKEYEMPENILSLAKEYSSLCNIAKNKYIKLKDNIIKLIGFKLNEVRKKIKSGKLSPSKIVTLDDKINFLQMILDKTDGNALNAASFEFNDFLYRWDEYINIDENQITDNVEKDKIKRIKYLLDAIRQKLR